MATQITTISAGNILIETGHGVPTHIAPKGSQFTDIDTANLYFNKDGITDWELNVDSTNSGATISINTFSTFSSTTVGQSSVVATNSSDLLSYSGINVSILTDNTNKLITFSASTGGGVNTYTTGLTYNNNLLTIKQNQGQPDLSVLVNTMTGLTVNGNLNVNTISATTYQNLPIDIRVTGGTPNNSNRTYTFTNNTGGTFNVIGLNDIFVTGGTYNAGTATFTNNTGGTFNVTGFLSSDTYVTGFTYNNNIFTIKQNQGQSDLNLSFNSVTGLTVNGNLTVTGNTISNSLSATTISGGTFYGNGSGFTGIPISSITNLQSSLDNKFDKSGGTVTGNVVIQASLTANTISATTYQNLPIDIRVTGGTYSSGTATFTNNTGGTFNVTGFTATDTYVTGFSYNNNVITLQQNQGQSDKLIIINTMTGLTVNGGLTANTISGGTLYGNGSGLTNIPIAGITNLQSSLDNKFDKSGGTVTGSVLITGDVTILGTATTINTQTLTVKDNIITINNNYSGNTAPYPSTSGIEVLRGSATTATLLWDETSQKWVAGVTGNTRQILFSGDSLSLLISGHTHPISEIINLQSSLDSKFDKSGGIVSGNTLFTNGITATTISATTYLNLPLDIRVTGGTYSAGTVTMTNNTGGTFNITGFSTSTATAFTGGTVTGATNFTGGVTANTISATTYFNLPLDITVTGGTYNAGTATFTNNTGGTFNVTGFTTTDTYVTGFSYNNNTFTIKQNQGQSDLNLLVNTMTGLTINGNLTVTGNTISNTISATTYQNLPLDIRVTGASYSNNTFTYTNNTGGTFSTLFNTVTGLTVNGNLTVTGNTSLQALTGTSALFSGSGANILTVIGSGSTTNPIFSVQGSTGATIFSISDSTSGPLFWVDTALDVPIMEVYDTSPNLIIYGGISASTITATTIYATTYLNLPVTADTFVTGFTVNSNNTFTISQNQGRPNLTATINTVTGLTINGNLTVTGNTSLQGLTASTISATTYNNLPIDIRVTGGTYSSGTAIFTNNTGGTFNVTGFTSTDTYVTGFTYSANTFTIKRNQGQSDLTTTINTVTGLTLSNLTAGRVVYVGTSGLLTDEAGFTYDANLNTLSVPSDGTVNVGTGGLNVAGNAIIQGSLTVFGPSVSAFTTELYIEDSNVTLNYNPTGSTTITSVGAGLTIQDGSGISNTGTSLNIGISYLNSNLSPNTEYTASTGNSNRNLYTQVGDIIIRNTNNDPNSPDGFRVLTENNILDGGSF